MELSLEGTRNLNKGLWDILIQTKTITPEKYVTSNIHPGLYLDSSIQPSIHTITFKPPSKGKTHTLSKDFQVCKSLIESNTCDHIID